jgi:hypothetical protein
MTTAFQTLERHAQAHPYTCSPSAKGAVLTICGTLASLVRTTSQSVLAILASMAPMLPHYEEGLRAACRWSARRQLLVLRLVHSPLVRELGELLQRESLVGAQACEQTCAPALKRAYEIFTEESAAAAAAADVLAAAEANDDDAASHDDNASHDDGAAAPAPAPAVAVAVPLVIAADEE